VVLLFTGLAFTGVLLLVVISAIELKALFKSQIVVQDYNNGVMEAIYREIIRQP
jgi:hypothetical protein